MKPTKGMVKVAQKALNEYSDANISADGLMGPGTSKAIKQATLLSSWEEDRKIIGLIQYKAKEKGINSGKIDGRWGPQTDFAYEQLKNGVKVWRDDEGLGALPVPPQDIHYKWPRQVQSELVKFYGQPGTNQGKVTCPYPLRIAWAPEKIVTRFTCHEKIAEPVRLVMDRVLDHYGADIGELGLDLFGGCYNKRKMRGGNKWSTHAWGIAIDWDPSRNRLKWKKDRANFAKPEYDMWWKLWEDEGFTSLGRTRNFDWMHVQAANVK